jgi:beta-xylosidase
MKRFCPGESWKDEQGVHINAHGGGVLRHDGRYYWFGEHKIEGEAGNRAQVGVHVYSSTDLYQWKDEGVALAVSDDLKSDIQRDCILERPKVIFNRATGKFVMWFHLELKGIGYSSARSGIAVADQPTGPYRYVRSIRPNAGAWPLNASEEQKRLLDADELEQLKGAYFPGNEVPAQLQDLIFRRDFHEGQMARDMNLFVDDDGAAYHVHASEENGTLHISQLSDDYLDSSGRYIRIFPGRFHEAPALMKRRGKYFLISSGCTGWAPNAARLSCADSIWGPWEELGNPCVGSEKDQATTFNSQSTYILPVAGVEDAFIFMADRWCPENAIDGRHIWLPIQFRNDRPYLEWRDQWALDFFATARS